MPAISAVWNNDSWQNLGVLTYCLLQDLFYGWIKFHQNPFSRYLSFLYCEIGRDRSRSTVCIRVACVPMCKSSLNYTPCLGNRAYRSWKNTTYPKIEEFLANVLVVVQTVCKLWITLKYRPGSGHREITWRQGLFERCAMTPQTWGPMWLGSHHVH